MVGRRLARTVATVVTAAVLCTSAAHVRDAWAGEPTKAEAAELKRASEKAQKVTPLIKAGKLKEAIALTEELVKTYKRIYGPDHKLTKGFSELLVKLKAKAAGGSTLSPADTEALEKSKEKTKKVGELFSAGKLKEAIPLLEELVALYTRIFGPDHEVTKKYAGLLAKAREKAAQKPSAATPYEGAKKEAYELVQQAMLQTVAGNFEQSLALLDKAMPIVEKEWGPESQVSALGHGLVASLCDMTLRFDRAEAAHRKHIAAVGKTFGPNSKETIEALSSAALHYMVRSDTDKAIELRKRAVAAARGAGADRPELVETLEALGQLQVVSGSSAEGLATLQEGLEIEKRTGFTKRSVSILLAMATASEMAGDDAKAAQMYELAFSINDKLPAGERCQTADSAQSRYLASSGDLPKAEQVHGQYMERIARSFGKDSGQTANVKHDHGMLQWSARKYDEALANVGAAAEVQEKVLARLLISGTEEQKRAFTRDLNANTYDIVSLDVGGAHPSPALRRLAVETVLRRKGRSLDAVADLYRVVRNRAESEDREALARLQAVRARLAGMALMGPTEQQPEATFASTIDKLEAEERELQQKLGSRMPEFRALDTPASLSSIQQAIPDDAAVVEFVDYVHRAPDGKTGVLKPQAPRFAAYIIRKTGDPELVTWAGFAPVELAAEALRAALRDPRSDAKKVARAFDEVILQPVRAKLGGAKHILLSPDSSLSLIPFGALVDENDKYLVENYTFTYLSSGRDLLRSGQSRAPRSAALIVGNPAFDDKADAAAGQAGRRSADLTGKSFKPLPGTAQEVSAIGKMLAGAKVLTEKDATERSVQQAKGPLLLHVASHGFFLEAQEPVTKQGTSRSLELDLNEAQPVLRAPRTENPLIRSGLAFAGANAHRPPGDNDGVLTALEASGLDLDGTRLVVLSACETGVGEVKSGEGVYGLRRALVIAGSESQVMSLWTVDDDATRELMTGLYDKLRAGKGRAEALREVQSGMIAGKKYSHPYYWAAFIQSGQWTPMKFDADSSADKGSSPIESEEEGPSISDRINIWASIGAVSLNMSNLPVADRTALAGWANLGVNAISIFLPRGRHLWYSDAIDLDLAYGQMRSDPVAFANASEAEPKSARGFRAGYTGMIGVGAGGFALQAGAIARYQSFLVGDFRSTGMSIPFAAELRIPLGELTSVEVTGWIGKIAGDAKARGVHVRIPISRFWLGGGWEQYEAGGRAVHGGSEVGLTQDAKSTMIRGVLGMNVF